MKSTISTTFVSTPRHFYITDAKNTICVKIISPNSIFKDLFSINAVRQGRYLDESFDKLPDSK